MNKNKKKYGIILLLVFFTIVGLFFTVIILYKNALIKEMKQSQLLIYNGNLYYVSHECSRSQMKSIESSSGTILKTVDDLRQLKDELTGYNLQEGLSVFPYGDFYMSQASFYGAAANIENKISSPNEIAIQLQNGDYYNCYLCSEKILEIIRK